MAEKLSIQSDFFLPLPLDAPQWAADLVNSIQYALRLLAIRADEQTLEGLYNEKPPYNGSKRFYFSTDDIALYYDTGAAWVRLGDGSFLTLDNSGTPSVMDGRLHLTGGTTTITDFDHGNTGQVIIIVAEHTLTITDGTNIFLSGSTDWTMNATDTLTLVCKADNKWYELSRSDNS